MNKEIGQLIHNLDSTPFFISGIGPPLQQLVQDYTAAISSFSNPLDVPQSILDVLFLIAAIVRYRDALDAILNYDSKYYSGLDEYENYLSFVRRVAREALFDE